MRANSYRLTVVGCVLSWFLVGMHLPALHEITHHTAAPNWFMVIVLTALVVAGTAGLRVLLRHGTVPNARSDSLREP